MALNRFLWQSTFAEDKKTPYPCPACEEGVLEPVKITFYDRETLASRELRQGAGWEPEWYEGRFSGILQCDRHACEEVVAVAGRAALGTDWDQEGDEFNFSEYHPAFFSPALPILSLPASLPPLLKKMVERSFSLFWSDRKSCGSLLETALSLALSRTGIGRHGERGRDFFEKRALADRLTEFGKREKRGEGVWSDPKEFGARVRQAKQGSVEGLLDLYELLEGVLS